MINRKLLALIFPLLLAGCSSGVATKAYYQLPSINSVAEEKIGVTSERQIWVADVGVSDYLNGLGIVYQVNDVQYVMANNNLWASSLDQQLQQGLIETLNSSLPDWLATVQSIGNANNTLTVNVTGFHGRYDGTVVVRGEWVLSNGREIVKKAFDIQMPQKNDGYDSLVRTLGEAWHQQSLSIADTIRQLESSPSARAPVLAN